MPLIDHSDIKVAHLFWDTAPHLERIFSKLLADCWPNSVIYFADNVCLKKKDGIRLEENKSWIDALPSDMYAGVLESGWWQRLYAHKHLRVWLSNFLLPIFNFRSIVKIAKGPKYWVIHGGLPVYLPTMFMFKLLGKRVVAIHWGGKYSSWQHFRFLGVWAHRMLSRIFVLMSPEIESFKPIVGSKRLSVLPYGSYISADRTRENIVHYGEVIPRCMILGNSAWRIDDYPEVLDKIQPDSWDKIICMLNYGDEEKKEKTDAFVKRYSEKFGDAFYPWRETLPMDEYLKLMQSAPFYLCAAKGQTGIGAIQNVLNQGKAVFIRGDNLAWFRSLGYTVYDLDGVGSLNYDSLVKHFPTPQEIHDNVETLIKFYQQNSPENWRKTLEASLFA